MLPLSTAEALVYFSIAQAEKTLRTGITDMGCKSLRNTQPNILKCGDRIDGMGDKYECTKNSLVRVSNYGPQGVALSTPFEQGNVMIRLYIFVAFGCDG